MMMARLWADAMARSDVVMPPGSERGVHSNCSKLSSLGSGPMRRKAAWGHGAGHKHGESASSGCGVTDAL